ncbi:MAG: restriction endonuclease subunit S [Saprospiraceae bacterium]|nr:restriction endonuclease subunit S [Saprospiraceae bacterium]
MNKEMKKTAVPKLRFPEFRAAGEWPFKNGDRVFNPISNKNHNSDLPILAITQEQGAIPRDEINYTVIATDKSVESYKVVEVGDFIISLRSFQGGIEYSNYKGICSPAYIILRKKIDVEDHFFRYYFKTDLFIQDLNKNLEGIRDGKMVSYKQFSELLLPTPSIPEQQKIAACLTTLDDLISAQSEKIEALQAHKKGLMQQLFPAEGERVPRVRFGEFEGEWEEEILRNVCSYFKGYAFQSKDYTSKGRRIVRVSDMGFDYIKDETNAIYISQEKTKQYEKWQLKKNDLIVTTVGSKPPVYDSLVGRTIVVQSKDENSLLNQNAVCLRANDKIEQGFLNILFKKDEYINFIESIIRGNANQGSIALDDLFRYKFYKPKPKEQQKIAACLTSLDDLIAAHGQQLEALKAHKKGLMQGLFPGGVV